jgi:hypothetical protein
MVSRVLYIQYYRLQAKVPEVFKKKYIFRFIRSYLVTDIGRILDAKGGFVNFLEA